MLNKEFVVRKIKLIQEELSRLEPFVGYTFDELSKDAIKLGAVERFLERIITRAIDINRHCIAELGKGNEAVRSYEDSFLRMSDLTIYPKEFAEKIAKSAGFRNVLVHDYDSIDHATMYTSVREALEQYAQYGDYLLQFLRTR